MYLLRLSQWVRKIHSGSIFSQKNGMEHRYTWAGIFVGDAVHLEASSHLRQRALSDGNLWSLHSL